MKPTWKQLYPWLAAAVSNLEPVDSLLQQTVGMIAGIYQVDCLLWAGLVTGSFDSPQVYATVGALQSFKDPLEAAPQQIAPLLPTDRPYSEQEIWQFSPCSSPPWLLEQQQSPQVRQLETGDLIVPIALKVNLEQVGSMGTAPIATPLPFVLQLQRHSAPEQTPEAHQPSPIAPLEDMAHDANPTIPNTPIHGWTLEDLESINVICAQLGLAYSALHWRQRLEQSRRQSALGGRIARLLNSSLNPDEIVGRIVAEVGQGVQCDRSILVDLRDSSVTILAVWDNPDYSLEPLHHRQYDPACWGNVVDMFLQGGASYLQVGITNTDADPLLEWLHHVGAVSALMVPLFTQDEFFGTVALLSCRQKKTYQLDELQSLRQVADQLAIALSNAQHYQSLWHKQEALRTQNKALQRDVTRDELTQLMNRRSLERELEQLSTRSAWATQGVFSIIVCDIDYFKLVNDTHGYRVGDEVLQVLAQRLQKQLRRGTPAYRYGGEEFVVILMETDLTKAVDVAERLRQAIRATPIYTSAGMVQITASFGISQQAPTQDREAWDVLHRADQALSDAKRQGRDRIKAV